MCTWVPLRPQPWCATPNPNQVPYVSNPGALAAAPSATVSQRRHRLLLFRGALTKQDLSPGVGQAIRGVMQRLQQAGGAAGGGGGANDTLIVDVRRVEAKTKYIGEATASHAAHAARRGGGGGGGGPRIDSKEERGPRFDFAFKEEDYSAYGARPTLTLTRG